MNRLVGWGAALTLVASSVVASAGNVPQSETGIDLKSRGVALQVALMGMGPQWGLRLTTSRYLEAQRVTLFGRGVKAGTVCSALSDLLSVPDRKGEVRWTRDGDGWQLAEDQTLRNLAATLRDADLRIFEQFLAEEIQWLRTEGAGEEPSSRRALLPAVLSELGADAIRRLLMGAPVAFRVGECSPATRSRLLALLRQTNPQLAVAADQSLSDHSLVLSLARNPGDVRGTEVIISFVEPSGFKWARLGGFLRPPGWRFPTAAIRSFTLPPPDPADTSPSITVNLSPAKADRREVRQDLNDVLGRLAEAIKTPIVSDGYLRPKITFQANLIAREYPREQLLRVVSNAWACDYRFKRDGTLLVRSRDWWLDDAADVRDDELRWVQATFSENRMPSLDALLRLSALSMAQLHRLREADLIPSAHGLVVPFFFDQSGGRAVLRFTAALHDGDRKRVLSESGLRLKNAPPELVERHLAGAIATHVGVVRASEQAELLVRILPSPAGGAFRIEIFSDSGRPRSPRWMQDVGLR